MSNAKKVQEEELKKLEDEAYFELCQIIAEAMQYQDIELLNARIASWKTKYKKLLDRPATNSKSDFKKRIEFLLNQYYSEVTKYILNQLKLKEEKKIENQAKALRELYTIIRDTNDYDLLKKKVDKWKEKYPVSGFLKMYQKRIELYSRDKNLRENAFKQEEAFRDLLEVTKVHGTLDELKNELTLWEEKYSINDKYTIDDFLKHQSEVKRFTSDEFLQSIARDNPKNTGEINLVEQYNNRDFSDIPTQLKYYARIVNLSKSLNNDEMFKLVLEMVEKGVVFNPDFVGNIIPQISKQYPLKNLNKIDVSELDVYKNSLSYEEFKNIDNIKRYAILSYFNMLLPQESQIPNSFFKESILKLINSKVNGAKTAKNMNDTATSMDDLISSGIEIPLSKETKTKSDIKDSIVKTEPTSLINHDISTEEVYIKNDDTVSDGNKENQDVLEIRENDNQSNSDHNELDIPKEIVVSKDETPLEELEENENEQSKNENTVKSNTHQEEVHIVDTTIEYESDSKEKYVEQVQAVIHDTIESEDNVESTIKLDSFSEEIATKEVPLSFEITTDSDTYSCEETSVKNDDLDLSLDKESSDNITKPTTSVLKTNLNKEDPIENLDYNNVMIFSPLFFATINNLDKQSVAVDIIDKTVNHRIQQEKSKEISIETQIKTKNDME